MEILDRFFKPFLLVATMIWVALAGFHLMSTEGLLIYLGVMIICVGIRNLIILNISYRTNVLHEKIQSYVTRYGYKKGIIYYGILLILLNFVLGIILIALNI